MPLSNASLVSLAKLTANKLAIDPILVCAVCEQESGWETYALRYEPGFYERYIEKMNLTPTEAHARSMSWGLMQIMGQTARENGFTGPYAQLTDPAAGITVGITHLLLMLKRANGDVHTALQLYNGGSNPNYGSQVMARMSKYANNT